MTAPWIRSSHKWLALISAIQIMIWLGSGVYMVLMDIEFIRGKHLTDHTKTAEFSVSPPSYSINDLLRDHPQATDITLYVTQGHLYYSAQIDNKLQQLDATTGKIQPLLAEDQARKAAVQVYTGTANIIGATLHQHTVPAEISPRLIPVWQLEFDDMAHSSLYISAITGRLVSTRHDYWRLFDILWMLHIMDYDTREDVHNPLLRSMTSLAILTALFGIALTYISFRNSKIKEDRQ